MLDKVIGVEVKLSSIIEDLEDIFRKLAKLKITLRLIEVYLKEYIKDNLSFRIKGELKGPPTDQEVREKISRKVRNTLTNSSYLFASGKIHNYLESLDKIAASLESTRYLRQEEQIIEDILVLVSTIISDIDEAQQVISFAQKNITTAREKLEMPEN